MTNTGQSARPPLAGDIAAGAILFALVGAVLYGLYLGVTWLHDRDLDDLHAAKQDCIKRGGSVTEFAQSAFGPRYACEHPTRF